MSDLEIIVHQFPPRREIEHALSRMELSADTKLLLHKLMTTTARVGERIIEIGRYVVSFVLGLLKQFPGTVFGVCISITLSLLIANIPLIGGVLGALLGPLVIAFGLTIGALEDLRRGMPYELSVQQFTKAVEATVRNS